VADHHADADPPGARDPRGDVDEASRVRRLAAELDIDVALIEAEERAAAQRRSMIEAGRRKGGVLGAAAAGAMIGLRDVYIGPPEDDGIVIEVEAAGEPTDIDLDGITGRAGDVDYWAPPPADPRA
jgi:hypothetical protein